VAIYCNDDLFHKEYAKVANQVTFTIRMEHLFSENILECLLLWVAVGATAVQVAFLILAFPALGKLAPAHLPMGRKPGISVIICARNEELNLKKHLSLWLGQVYEGEWELVIVNDSSTDGTPAVVEDFQKEHSRLRLVNMVYKERAGKKQALAAGIRSATFDWLLFTDADCRPAGSGWIRGMAARMLATPDIRIVTGYGPLETPAGLLREWPRWEAIHTAVLYMTFAHAGMPYMGVGRNLAIHRSVYDAAGGFRSHEHLASGDDDLLVNAVANASNTAVCTDPETFMYSAGKTTFRDWHRQKKRHLSAGIHYKRTHQMLLTLLAGTHVIHYAGIVFLLFVAPAGAAVLWIVRAGACVISFRRALVTLEAGDLYTRILPYDALTAVYYVIIASWESVRGLWRSKEKRDTW
jgi:glycosyltransferase involved in cell wall biosynthesis